MTKDNGTDSVNPECSVRQCRNVWHYEAGDLDVACDLPAGHAGPHHDVPA